MARTVKIKDWGKILTEASARKEFGLTDDIFEAGYILSNGDMLDFSEKRHGGPGGQRIADHRQVAEESNEHKSSARTHLMWAFCAKYGAIRTNVFGKGSLNCDVLAPITSDQKRVLVDLVAYGFHDFLFEIWALDLKFDSFQRIKEIQGEYDEDGLRRAIDGLNRRFEGMDVDADKALKKKVEMVEYVWDSGYSEDEANEIADDLNRQHPETEHEVGHDEDDDTYYVYEMRPKR